MITHRYLMATMIAVEDYPRPFSNNDTFISYLPYAHLFEQAIFWFSICFGMKHGYYQGNPLLLFDDIAALKPTIIVTVPRILNRIYTKVLEEVSRTGCCKRRFF
mmetsp:Transcript_43355/g.41780  ORF Transcript_43355/g.41780 Transcript_43355/m.41780 type:complete len:104 (+) Transcript_43355:367-678(+)